MKLMIATHNDGKLREFSRILSPLGFDVVSQKQIGAVAEVEETGKTFAENARIKAMAFFEATGIPSVADDSGLCVEALDLRPGVYSARYCGEDAPYDVKIASLINELEGKTKDERAAYFESAVCCVLDKDTVIECSGRCCGWIGFEPKGDGGFGYDPVFMVGEKSFAQMTAEEKDKMSHRGKALEKLYEKLREMQMKG
ncbi:MAG: RdgB/HAM1 family non-canonical purine NTP pyrophosphatase [Oscillospiraceae bacterium]|nr:RdgB/HAM1 family non-canonical purine NTP pyrophosphatase [Oscillospiraceae bacterium]